MQTAGGEPSALTKNENFVVSSVLPFLLRKKTPPSFSRGYSYAMVNLRVINEM